MSEEFDDFSQSDESGVPVEFHSVYLSGPFVQCIDCECDLLETDELYSIVKGFVGNEVVFEMAICADCSRKLGQQYSEESRAHLNKAIENWKPRQAASDPTTDDTDSPEEFVLFESGSTERLAECLSCGRPRSQCHRHSIVGLFIGRESISPRLLNLSMPLMICDECNMAAAEGISRQTRDAWDRFVEEHFDGPPGIELDSPKFEPVLI